jgi:hypothetical protein
MPCSFRNSFAFQKPKTVATFTIPQLQYLQFPTEKEMFPAFSECTCATMPLVGFVLLNYSCLLKDLSAALLRNLILGKKVTKKNLFSVSLALGLCGILVWE